MNGFLPLHPFAYSLINNACLLFAMLNVQPPQLVAFIRSLDCRFVQIQYNGIYRIKFFEFIVKFSHISSQ